MIHISHFLGQVRHRAQHMDDFENFLYILTLIFCSLLFIRVLIALYMGRWNLFI